MQYNLLLAIATLAPFVAAHGKIAVVQGDAGGNGTALAIKGGVVPGAGKNSVTEVDTTVFKSTKIATNGLGHTTGSGKNKISMIAQAMQLSGNTLPQVSANGGSISGTYHIVTTDGAGPLQAIIDTTGKGKFKKGTKAEIVTQVPGKNGNIRTDGTVKRRSADAEPDLEERTITGRALVKRAANVDRDFPIKINVPAGTTCTGTMGGQSNVCLMKIANSNPAGPFGGVIAFQIAGAGENAATATVASTSPTDAAAKRDLIPTHEDDEEDE